MAEPVWFRTYVPRAGASRQLIVFPHAGGSATRFRDWGALLPDDVELLAVQYPGRQDRIDDPLPADIPALADELAAALEPRLGRRRTAFFGHSMGAVVAYEVARRLRPRYPSPLARLFVSAADAPPARGEPRPVPDDDELRRYVKELGGLGSELIGDAEMWQLAGPAIRHDFRLVNGYRFRPGPPLTCPITTIVGDRDLVVAPADMHGWRSLTIAAYAAHVLPGGHFYLDEALPELAPLLGQWETGEDPEKMLIHDLVARQAAATPDAVAVTGPAGELTYTSLDQAANRLARVLVAAGAGPGRPVAVRLHRSRNLPVALLAAWRAGAPYVPLDPDGPWSRSERMLADCGAAVLLAGSTPPGTPAGLMTLLVDDDLTVTHGHQPTPPAANATVDDPAYLLYTSGSTGQPKAVVITHGGIANYVRWRVDTHGLGPDDRILQKTAVTFDAAGWEIFAPLVSGGAVVLPEPGLERDPAALVRAVADGGITVLQVVPSVLQALVADGDWTGCAALRVLSSAGEPLHAELVQRFLRAVAGSGADVKVWNTYGPTECSIDVTAYPVDPLQRSGPVPIGRAVTGMRVELGDDDELVVGGVGVAQGYLGRPELTAERFVPDPAGPPGSRRYRTGDRGRPRVDGNLEYAGRIDQQVKINGVRIEPGEVAATLDAHPGVLQSVVTAYRAANGTARLAAYVRLREPGTTDRLAPYLRQRLPEAYVPAAYVELTSFPTTPNGKVDVRALPAPDAVPESAAVPIAEEELVIRAWREVLGVEDIDRGADFFRLGGSSLQLTRLANRLRELTGRSVELPALLNATTPANQALLVRASDPATGPITRVDRTGGLPLSSGQYRIWLQDRLAPGSREWVSAVFLPLAPVVVEETVRAALDTLVARHEALRTRFATVDGDPVQHIDPPSPADLRVLELPRERIAEALDRETGRGFDLERGPLLRALLFREPSGRQTAILLLHHIVCDGWSSAVLEREFRELVAAAGAGREPRLADLPVRYADYAAWQRARLTSDALAADVDYWRTTLDGVTPAGPLTDRPRPPQRDAGGAVVPFSVPAGIAARLDELGRSAGTTLFATLLTAYATLLSRVTGRWDIPIGSPVAGRERPELEGVVGFFLNTLVLRCRLGGDWTFPQALEEVRDVCAEAFAHQALPFDRLVAELAPDRDPSRTPLYQVAFDFHGDELTGAPEDADDLDTMVAASRVAKTDLTLYLRRRPDGRLTGLFEYATALFDHATVQRLARCFAALLTGAVAGARTRLDELDLVPAAEIRNLIAWGEGAPAPAGPLALERFAQAATAGDVPAVICDDETLTFAELSARADQLAAHLQTLGVRPGSVLGVLLDRGVDLPVALLGAWKAGAAYVPLDPGFPPERVAYLLADSGSGILVTSEAHRRRLGDAYGGRVVLAGDVPAEAGPVRPGPVDPDLPAYVIYTSGSTGRPKGVVITHRGLANHLAWATTELAGRGTGGAPLFSSISFDLVVPNLWAPLLAGQPVHLLPEAVDLTELGARLRARAPYAFIKLTPGHLEILSHQIAAGHEPDLAGVIVVAGEALPPALARRWATALGTGRLINEYGPTETSVGACTFPVTGAADRQSVPIGRPLPGMTMRVLDERYGLTPIGALGELYVGGAGVARGYAGRPELTAERFLPDPYGAPGARMYRTGDLARVLPGGDVDFLGRRDEQVKIRGYRVEPGEVSAVLREHPDVRDAAVVVDGEALVGYCVLDGGTGTDGLLEYCARRLPAYLLPSAIVAVDGIPLTANGKLDRAALAPATPTPAERVAPRGIVEERIADLYAALLPGPIHAHSHFFASGGNSILAIRLIASIQQEFEVTLPMRAVFAGSTVAELAAAVEAELRAQVAQMSEEELVAAASQTQEG